MKINEELKSLIPPLQDDEYSQLELNIIADGCREPLVLWKGTLIDGHNRHKICTDNDISFSTTSVEFDSLDDAKTWMIDNQHGRRNLTDGWKYTLSRAKKEILLRIGRDKQSLAGGDRKSEEAKSLLSIVDKSDSHNTQNEISKDLGWSTGKVARADKVWDSMRLMK